MRPYLIAFQLTFMINDDKTTSRIATSYTFLKLELYLVHVLRIRFQYIRSGLRFQPFLKTSAF